MKTAPESIYSRQEVAWYNKSINNGFAEVVNNIQITSRMAKGFKNIDYFITIVYLCNCKLEISFD